MPQECRHLVRTGYATQRNYFTCAISKNVCVASSYENSDPGHPASCEIADYSHYNAENCPLFDTPDDLVETIKQYWESKKIKE